MFEDKKWSKALKERVTKFLVDRHLDELPVTTQELVNIIELAIEEGFEDAKETVNDWYDNSDREPVRDESRD